MTASAAQQTPAAQAQDAHTQIHVLQDRHALLLDAQPAFQTQTAIILQTHNAILP